MDELNLRLFLRVIYASRPRCASYTILTCHRTVVIDCPLTNTPVTCNQNAHGGGQIQQTTAVVDASDVLYQEVSVTATPKAQKTDDSKTKKKESAKEKTTTVTPTPVSTGGVADVTGRSWVGAVGAVGAGIVALAAL